RRLTAYAEAGADVLYPPGVRNREDVAAVVKEGAPKPVNMLVGSDFTTLPALASLGVPRISVGGALAPPAWARVPPPAREMAERGTFTGLARAAASAEIEKAMRARGVTAKSP